MKNARIAVSASLLAVAFAGGCTKAPTVSFTTDVMPVLNKHCQECHAVGAEGAVKTGFVIGSYDSVMTGTRLGPMVVAGDPLSSNLYRLVAGEVDESIRMPHNQTALSAEEIAVVETWIAEGALDN